MQNKRTSIRFVEIEENKSIAEMVLTAINAVLEHEKVHDRYLSVALTTDEIIHEYNREYRSVDRPTDVLSFPEDEGAELLTPPDGFLGDIMISIPRARAQSIELGHSLEREIMFLTIHGVLHLLGYDHMQTKDEAKMMQIQRSIMDSIRLNG